MENSIKITDFKIVKETEKAILLEIENKTFWFPKSKTTCANKLPIVVCHLPLLLSKVSGENAKTLSKSFLICSRYGATKVSI